MRRSVLVSVLVSVLCWGWTPAAAVQVSDDNFGQVVVFPYALAGLGRQTLIELRNGDPDRHLVISFQVKHLFGRPLFSANVVIGPNGSYATALVETDDGLGLSLARAPTGQCSLPDLSQGGNLLSYDFIDGPVSFQARRRFTVEAYALGYIESALAVDCAAFRSRYQPGGAWAPANSTEFRNVDVSAPENSLTGWATIIDTTRVTALHLRPLVLADFTDRAMNSAPVVATRPSLLDVNPPVSARTLSRPTGGELGPAGPLVSSWDEPIHAIDALLMSTQIEANFSLGGGLSASTQLIAYFPTRAYRKDRDFWGAQVEDAPFTDASDGLEPLAYDRAGGSLDVFPGIGDCGRNNASQLEITGFLFVALIAGCGEGEALVRVDGDTGTLVLRQPGESIVSLEGHRYSGLPVIGHTLTTLRTRFADGAFLDPEFSYTWARPMPAKAAVATPLQ